MQVVSNSSPAAKFHDEDRLAEIPGELSEDFGSKLKMDGAGEEEERRNGEKSWNEREESEEEDGTDDDDDDEEEEEEEFSFVAVNRDGSPITAEEAFKDGQIRPVFPLFNRDLFFDDGESHTNNDTISGFNGKNRALRSPLKKLFVEDRDGGDAATTTSDSEEPQGPYCSWSRRTVAEASPESCRKSNSTGFSKIWRFRDLVMRSNSDGKDAFVFLNNNNGRSQTTATTAKQSGEQDKKKTKTETPKKGKDKAAAAATSSAHERIYKMNRAMKEEGKRKSYLPYKQVGFFTNVNGLSRNIHPF